MNIESSMNYQIASIVVLIIFYAIYYIKMFFQKRQGIKTNQIGSIKEKKIHLVERLMSLATITIVIVQVISIVMDINYMVDTVRFTGMWVALLGDCIFFVSVYTMKDSWRAGIPKNDNTKLVTTGIYKYSRNPAFLGFDLMYIGVLFMYFNIFTFVFTVFVIAMLHLQILQEEAYLKETFKDEYLKYMKKTFRYFGNKS